MNQGLFALSMRVIVSVASVCVGLGAMGVDVQGMLHMQEAAMIIRYAVGLCGAFSMYAFVMSCCGRDGSCRS